MKGTNKTKLSQLLRLPFHSLRLFVKDLNEDNILTPIIFKIIIVYIVIVFAYVAFDYNERAFNANFIYESFKETVISVKNSFFTWDGMWYLDIADHGYTSSMATNFYPLYPAIISIVRPILNIFTSALFISNVFYVIGASYFYKLVKSINNKKIAFLSLILLLLFPTSFYFSLAYTESLCFMLFILFFYFLEKGNIKYALIFSFLVTLSRPIGISVIVPLAYFLIRKYKNVRSLILMIFPVLGYLFVHFIFYLYTGSWFESINAQKYWVAGNSFSNLFHPVDWFLKNFYNNRLSFHGLTNSFIDRVFFFLFTVILFPMFTNKDKKYFLYALSLGLIPAFMGMFMAYSRYLLIAFPIFIQLAKILSKSKYLKFYLFAIFITLQIYFIIRHSLNYWVA